MRSLTEGIDFGAQNTENISWIRNGQPHLTLESLQTLAALVLHVITTCSVTIAPGRMTWYCFSLLPNHTFSEKEACFFSIPTLPKDKYSTSVANKLRPALGEQS